MNSHSFAPPPQAPLPPSFMGCDEEPIHIPGAIQPHGAMLAFLVDGLIVTHASANLASLLGVPATAALGQPLGALIGEAAALVLATASQAGSAGDEHEGAQTTITVADRTLRLRGFLSDRHICIDMQPVIPEAPQPSQDTMLRSAMATFARATRTAELCALAVVGLKMISGYDRVMAYRFAEDGHGEVIAEAREPHMPAYLGLHYPAADVPPQSRRLFLRHRVCLIADTSAASVPLLSDPAWDDGAPLDLTRSTLRSISPIHLQYLRNMGVAASLSVALVRQDENGQAVLWGMFVCHGDAPRVAGIELQSMVAMMGEVVSMLLRGLEDVELHVQTRAREASLMGLVQQIAAPAQLSDGLTAVTTQLLQLVDASGALIRISGADFIIGTTPPLAAAERAFERLYAASGDKVIAVDDLAIRYPELADCIAEGAGALLMPLPQAEASAILWFRPERSRTVTWGGNPEEHTQVDPVTGRLSPRGSFAAWIQIEKGRSAPWSQADRRIAKEFRGLVRDALAEHANAALARLRHYDPLTGLPNRSLLQERLNDADGGTSSAQGLAFLDLDGFKAVNDTMGHVAGDVLLKTVAQRLRATAGADNLVARLGGDEFVVLCPGLDQVAMASLGERIRWAIELEIDIDGRTCHVTSSIGIAIAGQTGGLDLVRAADMAMYEAKRAGGNRAVLFEPALYDRASLQFELEEDMRNALDGRDELVLLYQPIFAVGSRSRQLAGFEALVRWRHPTRGWMSPAHFIPLAEKTGLIVPMGDWVLATALRHGRLLRQAQPNADLFMNVNVSILQIQQPGFCVAVARALETAGYPADALRLEVVESMLADAAAGTVLADVRRLGVQVAIDDFGIGFSSLSYLRRLPVDTVKLDRSFLEDVVGDPRGAGFVQAVVGLAHAAGKPVVFEGIETEEQFALARISGADLVQGFFFAPPLSANAAMELVIQHSRSDGRHADQGHAQLSPAI